MIGKERIQSAFMYDVYQAHRTCKGKALKTPELFGLPKKVEDLGWKMVLGTVYV